MKAAAYFLVSLLFAVALWTGCTDSSSQGATPTPKPGQAGPTEVLQATLVAPPNVPPPVARNRPAVLRVELETVERVMPIAEGVSYPFWTFNNTVPGPLLRARVGDTIELTLKNAGDSKQPHSIDLHAVTGPGGGAVLTQTAPGGKTGFRFKALNPGLYVYHCATPVVPEHIANGMYGMVLVEPEGGLPKVDREYYVMQGEVYLQGKRGEPGLQGFSMDKMLAETADYVVFNGATTSLVGAGALKARAGETVRLFFGVGGPNVTSSFHMIGEIWDTVYSEGGTTPVKNVQTTHVPAGGATIVEARLDVPGSFLLVDHSLGRSLKGAVGYLDVTGDPRPEIFSSLGGTSAPVAGAGH